MRTFKTAALVITLSLNVVACDGDAGEGGGKDSGGAEAADGGDAGATDGGADGADGSADGGADGTDGADGADGGADGADGGTDGADGGDGFGVIFSDTFEDPALEGGEFTAGGTGCDNWVLTPFSYSGYDPSIGEFRFWVDGGLMRDAAGEFTSSDPLPAPAGGVQAMYLTGYASLWESSLGGHFDLRNDLITVEPETRYTLDLALGQRSPYVYGEAYVYLYTGLSDEDLVVEELLVPISTLPSGGFAAQRLELDPPDRFAGAPLGVRVLLYQSSTAGYTTFAIDNVTITTAPAAAN